MNVAAPHPQEHVRIELEEGEALHVLHPKAIVAFRGSPASREDRVMDLPNAYRKRKWVRSKLTGPAEAVLGLPVECSLTVVDIAEDSDLLFNFRHVLFYTDGLEMKSRIQKIRTAWITREWVRMRFSGPGKLGVVTAGAMASLPLSPDVPVFAEAGSLVAYPEKADVRLSVYGNTLASQHMGVQWQLTGRGPILIQCGGTDSGLRDHLNGDGIVKRLLRELLPFGGVYIK
ncbi:AIM24 family protein [Cohnella fermenti]|uniref:AIM24 family protein n=1 Tax=Cohnella fermenti TaxID=2565925 RepID=A0A4S4BFZ3_9BACL|nr:AIM24 family protein [Cohnella fermenti]THF73307.1 AIM24 family protein [Cohnella fermenti]